jgi:hypothetical protein
MDDITSYHEAGHILMAIVLGGRVPHATIEPDRDDGPDRHGDVRVLWPRANPADKAFAEKLVLTALAGPVAEMIYTGEPYHPGFVAEWAGDWQHAFAAAAAIVPEEPRRLAWLESQVRRVYALLDDRYWPAVAALADELSAHETLEEQQILEAVTPWL